QARAGPVVREQVSRNRVDVVCRNGEVWKRIAGAGVQPVAGWIVNNPPRRDKISAEHFFGGAVSGGGERRQLPQSFVERMKPDAIFAQRPSDRAAELVALQVLFCGSEEAPGVENSVSEELEDFAVELIRPALCDDVDDSGTGPLLGH